MPEQGSQVLAAAFGDAEQDGALTAGVLAWDKPLERTLAAIADIPEFHRHLATIDEGEADGKIAFGNRAAYGRLG